MQRYIIVDKYRDGEMSWEMKPHDHGDIAFYSDALADNKRQAEEIRVLRRALRNYNPDHDALRAEEEAADEEGGEG